MPPSQCQVVPASLPKLRRTSDAVYSRSKVLQESSKQMPC